jgi:hypothetical protein
MSASSSYQRENKDAQDRFAPDDATAVAIETVREHEEKQFASRLFHLMASRETGSRGFAEAILGHTRAIGCVS